jgi:hypothetical protein
MLDHRLGRLFAVTAILVTLVALSTVRSFDLSDPSSEVTSRRLWNTTPSQEPGKVLIVIRGDVRVNGYPASSGHTVLSGDGIRTERGADALVDLGSLGLIWISESTTVTVRFTAIKIEIVSNCSGETGIEVKEGQVEVRSSSGLETLDRYAIQTYKGSVLASARTGARIIVGCNYRRRTTEPFIGFWRGTALGAVALAIVYAVRRDEVGSSGRRVSNSVP